MIEQLTAPGTSTATKPSADNSSASTKTSDAKTPPVDVAPISPRLRFDSVSGVVVTEFLKRGSIQAQVPSDAVLAYLRQGLQADGLSKNDKGGTETA
ncbi:MAG: hypothetical protein HY053_01915 [Proteobacteria bacterium]|nr:hypothetical protein [Pseudomonadota bacterium]